MIYLVDVIDHRLSTPPVPFHQGLLARRMLSHLICLCPRRRKLTSCAVAPNSHPSESPRPRSPQLTLGQHLCLERFRLCWKDHLKPVDLSDFWGAWGRGHPDGDPGAQRTLQPPHECPPWTEAATHGAPAAFYPSPCPEQSTNSMCPASSPRKQWGIGKNVHVQVSPCLGAKTELWFAARHRDSGPERQTWPQCPRDMKDPPLFPELLQGNVWIHRQKVRVNSPSLRCLQ